VNFVRRLPEDITHLFGADGSGNDVIRDAVGHVLKRCVFCRVGDPIVVNQVVLCIEEMIEIGQQRTGGQLIRVQFTDQLRQLYLTLDMIAEKQPTTTSITRFQTFDKNLSTALHAQSFHVTARY